MKRRDFVKTVAMSGMAIAASDLVGDLIAQSPQGQAARVEVQGTLRRRARRSEAPRLHLRRHPLHAPHQLRRQCHRRQRDDFEGFGGFGGGGGGGRGGRGGRGGGGGGGFGGSRRDGRPRRGGIRRPRDPQRRLGLRQQPDRHRGRDPAHHAHGDRSRQGERHREDRRDVVLAPVRAYTEYWVDADRRRTPTRCRRRQAGARPDGRRHRRHEQGSRSPSTPRSASSTSGSTSPLGRLLHRAGGLVDDARRSPSPRARTARRDRGLTPAR